MRRRRFLKWLGLAPAAAAASSAAAPDVAPAAPRRLADMSVEEREALAKDITASLVDELDARYPLEPIGFKSTIVGGSAAKNVTHGPGIHHRDGVIVQGHARAKAGELLAANELLAVRIAADGNIIAVGSNGQVQTSTDGITWTKREGERQKDWGELVTPQLSLLEDDDADA